MKTFFLLIGIYLLPIYYSFGASNEVRQAFENYLEQKALYFSLPPEQRSKGEIAYLAAREDVHKLGQRAVDFFVSELETSTQKSYVVEILTFLETAAFDNEDILPVVRNLIAEANLNELYPSVIGGCIRYLAKNGSSRDLALLERLAQHQNPGIVLAAEAAMSELNGVASKVSGQEYDVVPVESVTRDFFPKIQSIDKAGEHSGGPGISPGITEENCASALSSPAIFSDTDNCSLRTGWTLALILLAFITAFVAVRFFRNEK